MATNMLASESQELTRQNLGGKKRRLGQFSLRSLALVLTLLCVVLGSGVHEAVQQRSAVERLRKLGGTEIYDGELTIAGGESRRESPSRSWIAGVMGVKLFANVVGVDYPDGDLDSRRLRALEAFPRLRYVQLDQGAMDVSTAARLGGLPCLEHLAISEDFYIYQDDLDAWVKAIHSKNPNIQVEVIPFDGCILWDDDIDVDEP